ncbi:site-specific integrase [Salegentibacter sp. LM13S]|uniref:tyrosine-type recombinase/integrase n=1 Tax=Salegentibacter lacus TaxID=2873599 RepID=UPI001CCF8C0A|nr:tyrosine-type recombinase/integrase [Salegentibacter lacus]MBZ9632534.1 site-specific integrase [Salegentibacter lacus]
MRITPKIEKYGNKGHYRILIVVHNGGKYPIARPSVKGVKISKTDWNPKPVEGKNNWVKTSYKGKKPNHFQINATIASMINEWEAKLKNTTPESIQQIKDSKFSGSNRSYLKYVEHYLTTVRNESTKSNMVNAIGVLKNYLEVIDNISLRFSEINKDFVKSYHYWLGLKYAPTSVKQYLGVFRTIFNEAKKDESLGITIKIKPFEGIKYKKGKPKVKALTKEQLEKFKNLDTDSNDNWEMFKSIWLFQFSGGYRVKDVITLRWQDLIEVDGALYLDKYTTKTTERLFRLIPINAQLLLTNCIGRYHQSYQKELELLNMEINNLEAKLNSLKEAPPRDIPTTEILQLLRRGSSLDDVEKLHNNKKSYKKELADINIKLDNLRKQRKDFIKNKILDLAYEVPLDYVFPPGNIYKLKVDKWDKEDETKYNSFKANYNGYLKRMTKEANIRVKLSSHMARHTASQILRQMGVSIEDLSEFLTHSSEETTKLYFKRMGERNSELTQRLGELL